MSDPEIARSAEAGRSRTGTRAQNRTPTSPSAWPSSKLLEPQRAPHRTARWLGLVGLGLGIVQLIAPRRLARVLGVPPAGARLLRLWGLREIASATMVLAEARHPTRALWARVAGHAFDCASLGTTAAFSKRPRRTLAATIGLAGLTAAELSCARALSRESGLTTASGALRVSSSIAINRAAEDVFAYWRDFENLPRFMLHLHEVRLVSPGRWRWIANATAGRKVAWEAELTAVEPHERLAWRSCPGESLETAGSVRFERRPAGRGTIVHVEIQYRPPGGAVGAAIAALFNDLTQSRLFADLRRLKQVLETGEVLRSDANPFGRGVTRQRPAQPERTPSANRLIGRTASAAAPESRKD